MPQPVKGKAARYAAYAERAAADFAACLAR
jgi:hypothetical protein